MQDRDNLTVSLTGGLGNQLFQTAAGLANTNGSVKLEWNLGDPRLNASGFPEVESFLLPNRIHFDRRAMTPKFIKRILNFLIRLSKSSYRNQHHLASSFLIVLSSLALSVYSRRKCNVVCPSGIGFSEIIVPPKHSFLVGYFQSYFWSEKIFEEMMTICPKQTTQKFEELKALATQKKILAVHVRLGDYLAIDTFGIPTSTYYENAIKLLCAETQYDELWLFSNEPEKAESYLGVIPRLDIRLIDDLENSPANVLELMRYAHDYVIANSTFSWWGAFLSYNRSKKVVAPQPWFKGEPSPALLIPTNWNCLPGHGA